MSFVMVIQFPLSDSLVYKIRHLEKGELLPEGKVPEDWTAPVV